ncbi:hypothetical protein GIB67_009919 [Kingdonia uniflora]|uniref:Uncharacterized protein n=1 Tax=Kingdonia uniflora TaxID=39325 RepID=A0A7J7L4D0_9MAGN|nr:hypothetical protein GIB67_009919 [Kingdonia uniflora]
MACAGCYTKSSITVHELQGIDNGLKKTIEGIIEGSSSCNKANKNGRGYAKPWSEWDNRKIKIQEWNEDCQPLGPNEPKLMSHLGNLARNGAIFPLTMLSWMVASNTSLDGVWKSVKAMAQKNSDNQANLTCHPRTGRKTFARVKAKRMEDNETIDDLSIYRATRYIGKDLYNTEDGSAEREETIRRRLLELPEEKRETNIKARDKIFKDVIGEDGHG